MSKHARDWALTAAVPMLAASGLGAAGIGPLAGLLAGAGSAASGATAGAGLLGSGEALGLPLMGSVSAPMAEAAMLAPPQIPTAGGFMATLQSPEMQMAGKGMMLANSMGGQQPQGHNVQMPPMRQQPQQPQPSPDDELKRRIAMQQAPFAAGAYFG